MMPVKFSLISLSLTLVFVVSCGKKNETKEVSGDEQTYASFTSEAYKDNQTSVKYVQNSKAAHSLTLKSDNSLEINFNATLGFVSMSAPDKSFLSVTEAETEAMKVATKALNKKDSKEKWEKVEKETKEKVAKDLAPISCSLKIVGKNLSPRRDPGLKISNDKGPVVNLDFEVVEVKGIPYTTAVKIPDEFHKKYCDGDKFVSYFKNLPSDQQGLISNSKFFYYNWFELLEGDTFLKSKKGILTFNVMSGSKLVYGSTLLEKK